MLDALRSQPLWLVLVTLALLPGVFEELTFRGFLFGSLRSVISGGWTVIASAVLFGVFHEVLFPGRLLTSAFLGLVLGWVRLRTLSVLPCMVLHVTHNGLLLTISQRREELIEHGWDIAERVHLPAMWLIAAAVGIVLGGGLIVASSRRGASANESSSSG
jgi:sodium transport system permease protein